MEPAPVKNEGVDQAIRASFGAQTRPCLRRVTGLRTLLAWWITT
jgi:hypothetical protein